MMRNNRKSLLTLQKCVSLSKYNLHYTAQGVLPLIDNSIYITVMVDDVALSHPLDFIFTI